MRSAIIRWGVLGQVLLALACGSSSPDTRADSGVPDSGVSDSGVPDSGVPDSGTPDSGTPDSGVQETLGSLTVTISGAPGDAAVQVSGPDGFAQPVTASRTLTELAPGTYTLTASAVRQSGQIVDTLFDPTPVTTTASVAAGETATATVTYAVRPGTGALYVPSPLTGEVFAYTDAMLADAGPLLTDGGFAAPPADATTLALKLEDGGTWQGPELVSVDAQGQLWVSMNDEGSGIEGLALFSGAQQATGGTVAPQSFLSPVPLDGGGLSIAFPEATLFDSSGNLWVANSSGSSSIAVIGKATLGSDAGAAIADRAWNIPGANGLAFDRDGNLWYSVCGSPSGIFQIAAKDLNADSAPTPTVSIVNGSDHSCPENIAFDSAGNLYAAECGGFIGVSKYPSWQLADGGSNGTDSTPAVTVTNPQFDCMTGIALDNADNVWVTDYNGGTPGVLYEFGKDQLETSGSPAPLRAFSFGSCDYCGIAFNPPAVNLPMAQ